MVALDFLKTMYGGTTSGYLTVWTLPDKRTAFFPADNLEDAARYAEKLFNTHDVYYGVGLRAKELDAYTRGGNDDVRIITAFWADLDVKSAAHKETNLPETNDDALAFLDSLPLKPSIVVSSGNGLHAYWLLSEPLAIATDAHRVNISAALDGWQKHVNALASERGWKFDTTSDLARVLRIPGGINHKLKNDARVSVIATNDLRYTPSDFKPFVIREEKSGTSTSAATLTQGSVKFDAKVGTADKVIENCAFIRHCRDNAAALSEPQWYAMLSNLSLCSNGTEICHAFSKPYPQYDFNKCAKKIQHAQQAMKPHTCEYIRNTLCFDCAGCKNERKSPAALAVITKADEARELLEGEISEWARVFDDDFISALSYAKAKMSGDYGKFKLRVKGKVNILDIEKCIKAHDAKARSRSAANGVPLALEGMELEGAAIPAKWQVSTESGIRRTLHTKDGASEIIACPDPVIVTRRFVNLDDGKERLELSFYKDGRWKSVIGSRTKVYNKASILGFGDEGLHVCHLLARLPFDGRRWRMPSRPKRPCSHPGCPELTSGQFCPTHAKVEAKRYEKYDRDPNKNKRYGRAWKNIRAAFLRENPLCSMCWQNGKLVAATTVHHKQKLTEGGTHDFANLQALCESCHGRVHAQQGDRWN